jgi:SAM-dependent methyltransferase
LRIIGPVHEDDASAAPGDWEQEADLLASRSLTAGDPTGWFEQLYADGADGRVRMTWSRADPHPLLTAWASDHGLAGQGRRAIVVGCGLGADTEYVAGLGYQTTGFDVSETAIRLARQRHPGSAVRYVVADLLALPEDWRHGHDLVVEIITVQALPDPARRQAITNIGGLLAPGGTLLVIAAVHDDRAPEPQLPPWPLRRDEVEAFAVNGVSPVRIELVADPGQPGRQRWRAEFRRR